MDNTRHKAKNSVYGHSIISCCQEITTCCDLKVWNDIRDSVANIFVKSSLKTSFSEMKEQICHQFHLDIVNRISMIAGQFKSTFSARIVTATVLEICTNVVIYFIKKKSSDLAENNSVTVESELSDTDQQILMYIAGYILFSLKKTSRKFKSNSKHSKMSSLISKFLVSNNKNKSFVSRHKEWVEKVSRGGLTVPNDDFFLLIRTFERIVALRVSNESVSKDVLARATCIQAIPCDVNVVYLWDKMCTDPSVIGALLLESVIVLYLTVRGNAFARNIKEKMIENKSKKGLRKTLKNKSKVKN